MTKTDAGTLYIVATPLGNLEDITYRAVRTLKEAGLIVAEDTRRSRKLLTHFGLNTRMLSYREQNHKKISPAIFKALDDGIDVALVTDAGTPVVSDPGASLVREAVERSISVVPIPGPSAVAAALSASGISGDSYLFVGFLPSKKKARRDSLKKLAERDHTLVFFEAPHRLADALQDAAELLGERNAVICREMTKLNEEFVRGALSGLAARIAGLDNGVKGEITVIVEGGLPFDERAMSDEELAAIIRRDERPVKEIVADLSGCTTMKRSDLYKFVISIRSGNG